MKYIIELDTDEEMRAFLEWRAARLQEQEANKPKTPLRDTNISTRRRNALMAQDLHYLEDVLKLSDLELLRIPNLSKKGIDEIRNATRKATHAG